jgi:hypothetical protein
MDYAQLLDDLVREHERCRQRREEADTELARLADLIRSAVRLLPADQQTRGDHVLDRLEDRPTGLTAMIRLSLADGGWQTPAELRDFLSQCGLFASYRSNPLASIHTTLKRLVPDTLEKRRDRGAGISYRLKRGEPLSRARAGAARLRAIRGEGFAVGSARSWIAMAMPKPRPAPRTESETPEPPETEE